MTEFISYLTSIPSFRMRNRATKVQIQNAESALGLCFSEEYRNYLLTCGAASVYGHEFTGICSVNRLNVVAVTEKERSLSKTIPASWYVIEQLHIEGIVIWQNKSGEIFQTAPYTSGTKIADSMAEYLSIIIKNTNSI